MISIPALYDIFLRHRTICTDTRSLKSDCLFFALKGPTFNGNQFAKQALEAGAAYAIVDESDAVFSDRCLLVPDVLTALQSLAHHHRKRLTIPVLGITGSNGKTTTKELVRAVLAKKFVTLATRGNLNNHIGVPLTLLSITDDVEFSVVEMGANHQQEISSYCTYAEPNYGLITNVGKAHLEGFGGFEGVKRGKGELYDHLLSHNGLVFLNGDNLHLTSMVAQRKLTNVFRYGTDDGFECSGRLVNEHPFLHVEWRCGSNSGEIRTQLVGVYNFENILSAIAIGNRFGVAAADIDSAIAAYVPDNSRSQLVQRGTNTIILDAYNANPTSMEAALNNFNATTGNRKVICMGDMAELGDESDAEHERIVRLIARGSYHSVVLVGKNFGKYLSLLNAVHFEDSVKAAEWVKVHPWTDATVLIKGSRSTKMERILEAL